NLAPEGAVIKATALDPSIVGDDQVYRHRGPARVFVDERDAIRAVKGATERPIRQGDVIVLIGTGPSGTGMQETAQITTALRYLPWGKHVALLTDGRFSGFSSGACVGHIGPEALHGGPIGRVRLRRRSHRSGAGGGDEGTHRAGAASSRNGITVVPRTGALKSV